MIRAALLLTLAWATPGLALDLTLPGAEVTGSEVSEAASARLPEAPWSPERQTPGTEGAIRKTALKLGNAQLTTLQLLAPLRDQLQAAGYGPVFACASAECGGFDFRFQLDLVGEPAMHVDLGDYRYLLMRKAGASPESVALLASRSRDGGFVHITEVSEARLPEITITEAAPAPPAQDGTFLDALLRDSHAVLEDLDFGSGSSELGDGPYASLATLAGWLAENPSARVILVGHTDAVGSLEANTALSRRRAASTMGRLISAFGTDRAQLQSAGAGYLAPIASNLTEEGRARNRRVEVVLLSLE
ncbi:MAG: OmpA family protein [Silicimonas sp.]|nr:OmpA family protein [Silicimonas sp.]